MGDTSISWTDKTWNPIRGCRRISAGCENCYAERQANRFAGKGGAYDGLVKLTASGPRWSGKTKFVTEHLTDPLRWKKPRRIFVDSMSDLFYEEFTDEQIEQVFTVMALAPRHTFQVLTKRAERMREWSSRPGIIQRIKGRAWEWLGRASSGVPRRYEHGGIMERPWPLPNVWLGVSVENQAAADERIPELLATPAAVRFLSCEPLIGPVTLPIVHVFGPDPKWSGARIGWVISGCESGPGARRCDVEWLRSLRDQCAAARTPYFLKQAVCEMTLHPSGRQPITFGEGSSLGKGNVVELPYLDGVQHAAFPDVRTSARSCSSPT